MTVPYIGRRPGAPIAIAAFLLTTACDGVAAGRAAAPAVRDSAGITIVENTTPAWASGGAWLLGAEPTVEIGALEGSQDYQFHQIRSVAILSDGRIVVANGGTSELRFFSAEGRYLSSAGKQGGGPGEFQNLSTVEQVGDVIHAFDGGSRRISVFTLDGEYLESFAVGEIPGLASGPGRMVQTSGMFQPAGRFGDGSFAFGGADLGLPDPGSGTGPVAGRARQSSIYLRVGVDGTVIDTIGRFAGPETVTQVQGNPGSGGPVRVMIQTVAFAPFPRLVARGDRAVYAAGDSYELAFHTPEGELERLVRRSYTPEHVTDRHLDALHEERRGQVSPQIAAEMAHPRDLPYAEVFPPYGTFQIDAAGHLWVQEFRRPGESGPLAWEVFDDEGTWLGNVSIPSELRVLEIANDYILGVWTDDLGVEYVRVYPLEKP